MTRSLSGRGETSAPITAALSMERMPSKKINCKTIIKMGPYSLIHSPVQHFRAKNKPPHPCVTADCSLDDEKSTPRRRVCQCDVNTYFETCFEGSIRVPEGISVSLAITTTPSRTK